MATVTGKPNQVRVGPGKLYAGAYGTAVLPTTLAAAANDTTLTTTGNFKEIGFTADGSSLTYSQTADGVEVAERLRPIKRIITGVDMTFEFTMTQLSPENLRLATNSPTSAITTTANEITFVWPKSGGVNRASLLWVADDNLEALILAKCFAAGDISIPRRKGADPAAIAVSFSVEENTTGNDAWQLFDPAVFV